MMMPTKIMQTIPQIIEAELVIPKRMDVLIKTIYVKQELQISAFSLFSNIRKGRLLYIHPVGWLVGRLVGWLTSPLIFSIYRGIKAL